MLHWLLHQYLRQAAQQKLMEAVTTAAREELSRPPQPEAPPRCDIAIVFALNIEAVGVLDAALDLDTTQNATFVEHTGPWQGRHILVAETGMGRAAAAAATADLIALYKPAWVISAGFAGALVDDLRRGHILMADPVCDLAGNELSVGFKLSPEALAQSKKLHVGRLITVDDVIRTERAKRELAERSKAVACDMETAAVAEVCRQQKTRFLSVRIISDGVDDELPPEIEVLAQAKGFARQLGAAAGAILHRPSSIKDMWQLREDAIRYSDWLAKFLAGVVPQLPGPPVERR